VVSFKRAPTAQDGFTDTGLPHDEAMPHQILVREDERLAGVGEVAD
jgi:hypothetical protein